MRDPRDLPQVHVARSPRLVRILGYSLGLGVPLANYFMRSGSPTESSGLDVLAPLIGLLLLAVTVITDRVVLVIKADVIAVGFSVGFHSIIKRADIATLAAVRVAPGLRPVVGSDTLAAPWVNRSGLGILVTRKDGSRVAVACDLPDMAIAAINNAGR